jgi:hypothetical protein
MEYLFPQVAEGRPYSLLIIPNAPLIKGKRRESNSENHMSITTYCGPEPEKRQGQRLVASHSQMAWTSFEYLPFLSICLDP